MRRRGLKQFFSFFGSKVSLARHYPEPTHDVIVEPFAGSAGYSCLHFERDVRLYDIDPVIVGVWNYLLRASRLDILGLPTDPSAAASLSDEERWFIGFWWRRCGAYPSGRPVPWMLSGRYATSFWGERVRQRIADQVHLIKHWRCEQKTYASVEKLQATWFIDPPYQQQGHRYKFSSIDYPHLSEWISSLPGQKIVCEASGADWMKFSDIYQNRTVKYKKSHRTIQEQVCLIP